MKYQVPLTQTRELVVKLQIAGYPNVVTLPRGRQEPEDTVVFELGGATPHETHRFVSWAVPYAKRVSDD